MLAHSGVSCAVSMWARAGSRIPPSRAGSDPSLGTPGASPLPPLPVRLGGLWPWERACPSAPSPGTPDPASNPWAGVGKEGHALRSHPLITPRGSPSDVPGGYFYFFRVGDSFFLPLLHFPWVRAPLSSCFPAAFHSQDVRNLPETGKSWGRKGPLGGGRLQTMEKFNTSYLSEEVRLK